MPTTSATKKKTKVVNVNAWTNDPGSGAKPDGGKKIKRPAPKLATMPLALAIENPATAPKAALYAAGTAGFRYWTAAEALRRAADYWGAVLPGVSWQPGATLPIDLDQGQDLNAYYDRVGLRFFHDTSGGRTVYSGESPDVVCHELGHAVLDAIKPGLWDTMAIEVGSFHESFGDISALLSALQLPEVRTAVLKETQGSIARNSSLSRLAEQLGWAIRNVAPDAVDPDCLRNAANSFSYSDPQRLPRSAPASQLCREVHSFSRVFTGAVLDCLAGMLKARPAADSANLLAVSKDFGSILTTAVKASPIVTAFYGQVASHTLTAADSLFAGSGYTAALKAGFLKHAILSPTAIAAVAMSPAKTRAALDAPTAEPALQAVNVKDYDLGVKELMMVTASDAPRYRMAAAALPAVDSQETDRVDAAKSYLEDLIASGRVRTIVDGTPMAAVAARVSARGLRLTHEVREEGKKAVLRRLRVNCGFWACTGCGK